MMHFFQSNDIAVKAPRRKIQFQVNCTVLNSYFFNQNEIFFPCDPNKKHAFIALTETTVVIPVCYYTSFLHICTVQLRDQVSKQEA